MKDLKWGEIIKRNNELGLKMSGPVKQIALLSNTTNFQLKEILELELRELGIAVEIDTGDYDLILQDSIHFKNHDAVIVFWELSNLIDGFHYKYNSLGDDKLDSLANKIELEIESTLENLKDTALVLINKFTSIHFDENVLEQSKLNALSDRLNNFVQSIILKNQLLVNIEKIIAVNGIDQAIDYRQFQSSKSLYTKDFYFNYVKYIKSAFLASNGMVKKVLVLDCDNTLWGGILGEDGEDKIQMNDLSNKGKSYHEVQHLIRGYKSKGILLALCSKNNIADVNNVLDNHEDMILKQDDFVSKKVNWTDKAQNLIDLSKELNLGLDSFIFIDDSEFEIGLVQRELPQVKSVLVPKDLSEYPDLIRSLERDLFSFSLTKEDSDKTSMYIQETKRVEAKTKHRSMDDYLESLSLNMQVVFDSDISVDRAAQMTQKTNQFNLRTQRYTESEIQNFIESDNHLVSIFSLGDMYGDYGVTGLCIINFNENIAFIDTFLMSCRVIGRNVEFSFFAQIIKKLRTLIDKELILEAEWISTPKNNQVIEFYDNLGFECITEASESKTYRLSLSKYKAINKSYIKIIE
jgi:FkbH-like protein